ncbi:FAD-binding oxidoreductase [Streptomyces celluloflavus]|uniref:FAD-binding oxidoreductase n=1 Tax=Streptomyces celluloflavus TaxID=58344 RepID=UPI0037AB9073
MNTRAHLPPGHEAESALPSALDEWRAAIGVAHVRTDPALLDQLGTATYPTDQKVAAAICPGDRQQVRACLRIATRHKVPLYPVSTGKNWGYGSAAPVVDGCVVMPLSRMNRILDYDEEFAYVTVEPGVTQLQLHNYLIGRGARLFAGFTGSSPGASLIGNVMERGLGSGPYNDRFSHVCGFEVILATGEILHTGFTRYPGAVTGELHRWGVGPWLDGIFTQSNLGVVTRMTLWLKPMPGYVARFAFSVGESRSALDNTLNALRQLSLSGVLGCGFLFFNDLRILTTQQRYPWAEAGGRVPLPDDLRRELRRRRGLGAWNGRGTIHAVDARHGAELRRIVTESLGPHVDRLTFGEDDQLSQGNTSSPSVLDWCAPSESQLLMAYWRIRENEPADAETESGVGPGAGAGAGAGISHHSAPMDLDRDGCGLIWSCPVLPLNGRHVRVAVDTVGRVTRSHGFEANIGLHASGERTAVATVILAYDRSVEGEDDRAMACYDALEQQFSDLGYPPYRMSTRAMRSSLHANDDMSAVLRRLKNALDPAGILAPGRYVL